MPVGLRMPLATSPKAARRRDELRYRHRAWGLALYPSPKPTRSNTRQDSPKKREESLSTVCQVARVRAQCALNHIGYPKPGAQSQQDAATW